MIGGSTTVVGIVADPVAHVRTPALFNALMAAHGRDAVMVPLHVAAPALATFLSGARAARNLAGLVVTIPHKEAVLAHCTTRTASAQRVLAANVLRFDRARDEVVGTNTDGEGFLAGLRGQGIAVAGKAVYIAGAGGAAKAIADALAGAGVRALRIHNRTAGRAAELVERLRGDYRAVDVELAGPAPDACDLAVNATSLGLKAGDPLPFRLDGLPRSAVIAEVVMQPEVTPLLAAAQQRGHPIHPGRHMLDGQVDSIARFLGVLP